MPYTYSHLEDFIKKIYLDLNTESLSQLNIYTIADALNIGLYPISTISQSVNHSILMVDTTIFLNSTLTALERLKRLGMRLGHIMLHSGNQKHMNNNYQMYQEWKANLFALHFYLPTFMLQTIQTPNVYQVSETFGVSLDFANKRLDMYKQRLHFKELNKYFQTTFK